MRGLWKRALVLFLIGTLRAPAGALAEFSPQLEKMEKEGAALVVSLQLDSASSLDGDSLAIANEWLSRVDGEICAGKNSQSVTLRLDGEPCLSAVEQRQRDYRLTVFSPSGEAYITSPDAPGALALLSGRQNSIPDLAALPRLYAAAAGPLYAALERETAPRQVKEPTSIKNAASSSAYVNYVFQGDALTAAWPRVLESVLPAMKEALPDQHDWHGWLEEILSNVVFHGECRFKRLLDKEGGDVGLQFTGQAERNGDKRRVTLFGGYTPGKGGYISLSLPAVSGKNTLKASLGVKETSKNGINTLNVEGSLSRTLDGASAACSLEGTLKNTLEGEKEVWSGKITFARTENKVKTTWIFTPSLTGDEEGIQGQIALQKKEGTAVRFKGALRVRLLPLEETAAPGASSAKDLRRLTGEQARAAVQAQLAPLTGAIARLFAQLPGEERARLLHALRTDAWMNGPAVSAAVGVMGETPAPTNEEPAPEIPLEGEWIVEEDDL